MPWCSAHPLFCRTKVSPASGAGREEIESFGGRRWESDFPIGSDANSLSDILSRYPSPSVMAASDPDVPVPGGPRGGGSKNMAGSDARAAEGRAGKPDGPWLWQAERHAAPQVAGLGRHRNRPEPAAPAAGAGCWAPEALNSGARTRRHSVEPEMRSAVCPSMGLEGCGKERHRWRHRSK